MYVHIYASTPTCAYVYTHVRVCTHILYGVPQQVDGVSHAAHIAGAVVQQSHLWEAGEKNRQVGHTERWMNRVEALGGAMIDNDDW